VARCEVYANPTAAERRHTPFVLDVQNDHLHGLDSRVVIPLRSHRAMQQASTLNPLLDIDGQRVVVDTASLAPVPAAMLRKPLLRLDAGARNEVLDALDALFGSC
jgi:toxin CcdB